MKLPFLLSAAVVLSIQAPSVDAADAPKEAVAKESAKPAAAPMSTARRWFENLKLGLSSSSVELRRQKRSVSAVAAVRGAAQGIEDPDKPYFRGTAASKAQARDSAERAELSAAVDLALAGKPEEAKKAFAAFAAKHPGSALAAEAKQAVEISGSLKEGE